MIILGAGMSGCLAGLINPQAQIYEAQEEPPINHNAVLRFRDDSVSKVTGIPFKKVTVHKGLFAYNHFLPPDISYANMYSSKVLGEITDRSIWNLDPVVRYVAPPNFQEQLFNLVASRVELGISANCDLINEEGEAISTIPLPTIFKILNIDIPALDFRYQEISTWRYQLIGCNVHQTIYYPGRETPAYRATITGDSLIIETVKDHPLPLDLDYILNSFSLQDQDFNGQVSQHTQHFGKIAEIDDFTRRQTLYWLTKEFGIYSAGRFAIWKNILMDDVLQDLRVIKEMQAKDSYEHHRRY